MKMGDKKSNNKSNYKRKNTNVDDDFNPKFRKIRKKVCVLCSNKELVLDYKNAEQLKKFINEKGKILPRRATGACAKHQREITNVIKRARTIAILPYTQN
jgi:small subunit ribosomal protein S18